VVKLEYKVKFSVVFDHIEYPNPFLHESSIVEGHVVDNNCLTRHFSFTQIGECEFGVHN